jgi:hypothetical protein
MANGTVHAVELHAVLKILIAGRDGIGDVRSMALHGSIYGSIGQAMFPSRWRNISRGREKTKQSETKAAKKNYQYGYDDTENELTHGPLRESTIVAEEAGLALVGSGEGGGVISLHPS